MRHYSLTDQLYRSDVKNYTVAATGTSQVLSLAPASKELYLRNDGANDVYLAFDEDAATTSDFSLKSSDGLVRIRVQCDKIAVVCAAGETATLRVSSNF